MSDVASSRLPLPLRFAIRELRAGLRGFYVLVLCIALGVMAIAGIGSVADSLAGGLAREGRTILGGDVSFALIHRETKELPRPPRACARSSSRSAETFTCIRNSPTAKKELRASWRNDCALLASKMSKQEWANTA